MLFRFNIFSANGSFLGQTYAKNRSNALRAACRRYAEAFYVTLADIP